MPVVSISIPTELFQKLEQRKGSGTRSGVWTHFLDTGLKMDGHECPKPKKPRWADSHECPQSWGDYFRETVKKFPKGWTQEVGGTTFHVKPGD